MSDFKIDSGVKPPSEYKYPFKSMKVDQSFSAGEYSEELQRNIGSISGYYEKKLGYEFRSAKMPVKDVKKVGYEFELRVWRTK